MNSERSVETEIGVASVWYAGRWRTPEGIERRRVQQGVWSRRYYATVKGVTLQIRSEVKENAKRRRQA